METQEIMVSATGAYTPTAALELQKFRALRRIPMLVGACVGCGMIVMSQFMRIALSVAKVLIFDRPIYSAVSLWFAAVFVLAAAFLLVWTLTAPRRTAKRRMRQYREAYGTVPTWTVACTETEITLCIDGAVFLRYAYAAIRRCVMTQDLFVLQTKEKQFISIEKRTLSLDEAAFCAWIERKCPKAKRNWRTQA